MRPAASSSCCYAFSPLWTVLLLILWAKINCSLSHFCHYFVTAMRKVIRCCANHTLMKFLTVDLCFCALRVWSLDFGDSRSQVTFTFWLQAFITARPWNMSWTKTQHSNLHMNSYSVSLSGHNLHAKKVWSEKALKILVSMSLLSVLREVSSQICCTPDHDKC